MTTEDETAEPTIRVLLVDDQAMVRAGLRMILETEPDLEVIGEAANGREALELAEANRPHVVLIDVQMPVMDGLEATRRLLAGHRRQPGAAGVPPRVLVLTTFDLDEYVLEALQAGATGFLLKNAPADDLVRAVRATAAGETSLASPITRRMIEQFVGRRPARRGENLIDRLSPREREVLGLMAGGLSNPEIAEHLVVGEATVKTHVGSILAKLGLRDRVAAVIAAYEAGIVEPGGSRLGE